MCVCVCAWSGRGICGIYLSAVRCSVPQSSLNHVRYLSICVMLWICYTCFIFSCLRTSNKGLSSSLSCSVKKFNSSWYKYDNTSLIYKF